MRREAEESAAYDCEHHRYRRKRYGRTQSTTVPPDRLVAGVVIDHDVSLSRRSGLAEVDRIGAEVGVCEQGFAVPCRGILQ